MEKVNILGIKFNNLSLLETLHTIEKYLSSNSSYYIVTPNPEFVIASLGDSEFKNILNQSDLSIPDGIGVVWAAKILGLNLKGRVSGADLVNILLEIGSQRDYTFFFLGGKGDSAEKAKQTVLKLYPLLKIGTFSGEPSDDFDQKARLKIEEFARDNKKKIDFLLVAYGQKKQELWIKRNLPKLPVKVAIGVGGVVDYLSKNKKRAPKIVRKAGLEWLFRLLQEPGRWRRQLALPYFAYLVLKEKFK